MVSLKYNDKNPSLEHIKLSIRILLPIIEGKHRTFKWVKRAFIRQIEKYIETDSKEYEDFYHLWFPTDKQKFASMLLFRILWKLGYSSHNKFVEKTHPPEYTEEELMEIRKIDVL